MLSGPGAGGIETASAVVSDIVSIIARDTPGVLKNIAPWRKLDFYPDDDVVSKFYLRLEVEDEPGVLATIAQVFGDHDVSVESVIQQGRGAHAELVMVFHPVREACFREALEKLAALSIVQSEPRPIRIEGSGNDQ